MVTGTKNIVKVRYFNGDNLSPREYSYFSESDLQVGDIVTVPVRDGSRKAQVTTVGVPEAEIEAFREAVKTIPVGGKVEPVMSYEDYLEVLEEDMENSINTNTYDPISPDNSIAVINIKPEIDPAYSALAEEVRSLCKYADSRTIKSDADVKDAADDLGLISKLLKSIEDLRAKYVKPLNDTVKSINAAFKTLTDPADQANRITRKKIMEYRAEVERVRKEAEETNRMAEEVARRQAAASGTGEFTVNTEPVCVPTPAARTVRTETATLGTRKIRKCRVVDFARLPDMYKLPNEKMLSAAAVSGVAEIPGVEFYIEESLAVTGRRV